MFATRIFVAQKQVTALSGKRLKLSSNRNASITWHTHTHTNTLKSHPYQCVWSLSVGCL